MTPTADRRPPTADGVERRLIARGRYSVPRKPEFRETPMLLSLLKISDFTESASFRCWEKGPSSIC